MGTVKTFAVLGLAYFAVGVVSAVGYYAGWCLTEHYVRKAVEVLPR